MVEKTFTPARIALGAAGLIAISAIGVATFRDRQAPPPAAPVPPANSQAGQAPDIATLIPKLEEKLRGNTTDATGWRLLGWSYFEVGRYAESADAYAKAAGIDPTKAEYWSALGEATVMAEKAGVSPRAELAFRKALEADPKDARARYFLAVKKDLAGDHKGAVEDWLTLLKEGPANAPWASDVRQLVQEVAAKNKIDIAGRLPPAPPAQAQAQAQAPADGSGAAVATQGIPGPSPAQLQAAAGMPPAQQQAMIRQMVDGLAARLKSNPKDADGWIRLMRARAVLNDPGAARQALADGRAAFAGDPATLGRLDEAAKALGLTGA